MRTLVVDGYNVIAASPRYKDLAEDDLDSARAALVRDVAAFAIGTYRAIVVFDGGGNPASDGSPHHVPGAVVLFSAHGVDADAIIEGLVHRHRERGDEVAVVSSDAQLQSTVMGQGVVRIPVREFTQEVRSGAEEWREHNPYGSRRQTLDMLVDPDVRAALSRWARGERVES